ncbi:MAG TPA: beta-ketoacyl-[acyl-carrier-protein] synthase family protein [Acidimicrobiia bacterium]|nr:beta-ketoacyl-[acyl-carrier-protein] synthase family protein [Acidimicrobiia bacterium]
MGQNVVMERRDVVVTGIGVVAAPGEGRDAFWKGLGIDPGTGPHAVREWDPEPAIPRREARRLDRFAQFALVATEEALTQAGDLDVDPNRVTVNVATGIGGLEALETLIGASYEDEPRVSPLLIPMMMCNAAAAAISIKYGFGGQASTPVVACAAGAQAILDGLRLIEWGYADVAVVGGAEGAIRKPTVEGFVAARALSPSLTAKPFDTHRDGFVLGEGAAILILEPRERAEARGATILASLPGGASTADAHHITAPHPEGEGAERAVRLALEDAGLTPADIGYVNAHGTGTELNDRTEGAVIARVFGTSQPAVSSIKGTTGHALGASGAIEAAACILAIDRGELPPNVGLDDQDPDIPLDDIVIERRSWGPRPVISNSFGFGGHNTVLVVAPPE